jgi:NAD-dependent deacetylase
MLPDVLTKINNKRVIALTGDHLGTPPNNVQSEENTCDSINSILTLDFFNSNPLAFFKTYFSIIKDYRTKRPNFIHYFLKSMEIPVITQSFDGLHAEVGSDTIELHGNINYYRCLNCKHRQNAFIPNENAIQNLNVLLNKLECPVCKSGLLRPDVVFDGESLQVYHTALNKIYESEALIVFGHQNDVWPSNKLINFAEKNKVNIIIDPIVNI